MAKQADMSPEERAARKFTQDMKALAPKIAAYKVPVAGAVKASRKTEREMYWTKDPNVDVQQLWQAVLQDAAMMGLDEQTAIARAQPNIAMALYPYRQQVIQAGERYGDVKAQIQFDKRMAAAGPPEGMDDYG